jgi:glycosyltransferase involved in cell wall biosynthesis
MVNLSVIVPVYKVPYEYLRQCLDSLAKIELRDIEIIMVDDGSPDRCGEICDEYSDRDRRFVAIHRENGGVSAARNEGLRAARGEWITFVDADDWVEPESIGKLVDMAFELKPDILFFAGFLNKGPEQREGRFRFAERKFFEPKELYELMLRAMTIYALPKESEEILPLDGVCGKMYRVSLLKENNIVFPEGIPVSEDGLFLLHALKKAERVIYIGECAYHYRFNAEGAMNRFRPHADIEQGRYLTKLHEYVLGTGDDSLENTYYLRVLVSLRHCMEQKYFHPKNTEGYIKRRREFLRLINREPYRTALKLKRLYRLSKTLFLRTLLIRLRLPGLLFLLLWAKRLAARRIKINAKGKVYK